MKLSFVVPVYNAEKYLDNCIGSLYRQNLQENDFEIICVNDGSKDGSLEVLKRWQALHNNLVIINQENGGYQRQEMQEYVRRQVNISDLLILMIILRMG